MSIRKEMTTLPETQIPRKKYDSRNKVKDVMLPLTIIHIEPT